MAASNHSLLERAFEIADGGKADTLGAIRRQLMLEGFSYAQIDQLGGRSLAGQLAKRIKLAVAKQARTD